MSKLGLLGLTTAALVLGSIHCGSDEPARPKVRVGMLHWAAYAPINVADKMGFWAEEGVDVEVINVTSNQELNDNLATGRIDIALDMIGSWVGIHISGVKLKVIGETDWSFGGDQVIAKKDLPKTKESLSAKPVLVYLNQPSVNFFLGKYLETLDPPLKLSDIEIAEIPTADMAPRFLDGTYDLAINYFPQSKPMLDSGADELATSRTAGYQGVIPEGFVGRAEVIDNIPKETLVKVLKGWYKAVNWVYTDPDTNQINESNWLEYADILRNSTFEGDRDGQAPFTDTELRQFVANVKMHGLVTSACLNGGSKGMALAQSTALQPQPVKDYLTELSSFLSENGSLAGVAPDLADFASDGPNAIFDGSATIEALRELGAVCPN